MNQLIKLSILTSALFSTLVLGQENCQGSLVTDNAGLEQYRGCSVIEGSLHLRDRVDELSALENLVTINGDFRIGGGWNSGTAEVKSLSPLRNLNSVQGSFIIGLTEIDSLSGLNNLSFVGGSFIIRQNRNLLTTSGVNRLAYIGEDLWFYQNGSLKTVNGFFSLSAIGGEFLISMNSIVSISGFNALTTINDDFKIPFPNGVQSISGFSNLTRVGGDLFVQLSGLWFPNTSVIFNQVHVDGERTIKTYGGPDLN